MSRKNDRSGGGMNLRLVLNAMVFNGMTSK